MQGHGERPYRTVITLARAVHQLPTETTEWHLRQLSTDLTDAVLDLDARLRAGLSAPADWNATVRDFRTR